MQTVQNFIQHNFEWCVSNADHTSVHILMNDVKITLKTFYIFYGTSGLALKLYVVQKAWTVWKCRYVGGTVVLYGKRKKQPKCECIKIFAVKHFKQICFVQSLGSNKVVKLPKT